MLIIGIGNDSRQDDGLGWALIRQIGDKYGEQFLVEYRFQLNIEDADLIRNHSRVLFVDASKELLPGGCALESCKANGEITFSTHALEPEAVLALCEQVYHASPLCSIIKIQGYEWELEDGLSVGARRNLDSAMVLFCQNFIDRSRWQVGSF